MQVPISTPRESAAPGLLASVALLAGIVVFALAGLALAANWPKLIRVVLAFATYVGILLCSLKAAGRWGGAPEELPFWAFVAAGAGAGLVSGVARPTIHWPLVAMSTLSSAFLLGGFHWFALRAWRRVMSGIVSR